MEQWGKIADQNFGLLPPLVISKSGLVHDNMRQPVASPVGTWRTRCGWPFGSSSFTFGYGIDKVTCQKCNTLRLAHSKEQEVGKAGG